MRLRRSATAPVLVVLALGAMWSWWPDRAAPPEEPVAFQCRWEPRSTWSDQAEVLLAGRLPIAEYPEVTLERARQWDDPPVAAATWSWRFHNMKWSYPLLHAAASGTAAAGEAALDHYRQWQSALGDPDDGRSPDVDQAWSPHAAALRTQVLVCAAQVLDAPLVDRMLRTHADWLARRENYEGNWNHGLDEAIALLEAGCAIGDDEHARLGTRRALENLQASVDQEGVANEQAIGYQHYVWTLFGELEEALRACGRDIPPRLEEVRTSMPDLLAAATRPSGEWATFGDTLPAAARAMPDTTAQYAATHRREGIDPASRTAVFESGFLFHRDDWSARADWLGLRFGSPRAVHGHVDHTSLLYDANGRPVLVEAGFSGYGDGPRREYERSAAAHNVVVVTRDGEVLVDGRTRLRSHHVEAGGLTASLESRGSGGVVRFRDIVLVHDPDVLVVRDMVEAPSEASVAQFWHFPADAHMSRTQNGWSIRRDGWRTTLVPVHGPVEGGLLQDVDGAPQGWVATGRERRTDAPVLRYVGTGPTSWIRVFVTRRMSDPGAVEARMAGKDRVLVTVGDEELEIEFPS